MAEHGERSTGAREGVPRVAVAEHGKSFGGNRRRPTSSGRELRRESAAADFEREGASAGESFDGVSGCGSGRELRRRLTASGSSRGDGGFEREEDEPNSIGTDQ